MERKLLRKYYADRALEEAGVSADDLLCDSAGKILYDRTYDTVWFLSHEDGVAVDIQVTIDATRRDLLRGFSLLLEDFSYGETWELPCDKVPAIDLEVAGCEQDLVVRSAVETHLLPVYVLESVFLSSTSSSALFGDLRSQCASAMNVWRNMGIRTIDLVPEYGTVIAELARDFWELVRGIKRYSLLHELAEFCLEWGAEYYMPNLYPSNFRVTDDGLIVPYCATMSLPLYAIKENRVLYTQRREV